MSLFQTVKDNVTTRQAAERYGVKVNHSGMCRCPFHNDRNPSMKLYEKSFHCFGCQADGDVISFTGRLFNITPKEAAAKLASDFGISFDSRKLVTYVKKRVVMPPSQEDITAHRINYVYHELANYRNLLVQWKQQYAPASFDEEMHPRFVEALNNLPFVEYQLDMLLSDSDFDKRQIATDYLQKKKEQKGVSELDPVVKVPVYGKSPSYARATGELDIFRESHRANIECKKDIEKAIAENFDGMHLNKKAITDVMDRYGAERVSVVLAATVQQKSWDGRFSPLNKDWAFTFDFPEAVDAFGYDRRDDFTVSSHPAVLDGFISQVRQEIRERENPVEKAKNGLEPVSVPIPGGRQAEKNETRVEPISGFIPKERPAAKAEMKMEPLSGYKPVRPKANNMER